MYIHVMNQSLPYPSKDDVTLVPTTGILNSRSEAKLHPFIYSAPMDTVTGYNLCSALLELGEFPVLSRFISKEERLAAIRDFSSNENFFIAIGADKDSVCKLLEQIADLYLPDDTKFNFAIDVAHGDMHKAHLMTEFLAKQSFVRFIMSGSICTPPAADRCVDAGATHLRVGVGPGSCCTTRLMTGVGLPQFTAIALINSYLVEEARRQDVKIIADGGIRYPGDAVKYLAAGADAVMLGSLFAEAKESCGWTMLPAPLPDISQGPVSFPLKTPPPRVIKSYRGQASAEFQKDIYGSSNPCPEGVSGPELEWDMQTTCESVVECFRGGIRSAISYLGLRSLDELKPENVTFAYITRSAYDEGKPRR